MRYTRWRFVSFERIAKMFFSRSNSHHAEQHAEKLLRCRVACTVPLQLIGLYVGIKCRRNILHRPRHILGYLCMTNQHSYHCVFWRLNAIGYQPLRKNVWCPTESLCNVAERHPIVYREVTLIRVGRELPMRNTMSDSTFLGMSRCHFNPSRREHSWAI